MENLEQCLDQLARLYVSYRQRYVLCLPEGKTITPRKKDKTYCKLTNNVLRNHLLRKYAVAV